MKNLDFYDSDLQSDNPDDFHSDHEPPKDIVRERKLLKKTELLRIYKEIWQIGKGLPKPAKYDQIKLQYEEVQDPDAQSDQTEEQKKEMFDQYTNHVKQVDQITPNLGINNFEEWFEIVVESMKKGEVSLVILEYLKYDDNKMKILDNKKHYIFYLEDWTTVIDLNQDMTILKKIVQKGEGNHRTEKQDEVIVNYCLKRGEEVLDERNDDTPCRIESLLEKGMSEVVWRVIRSMKDKEISEAQIKQEAFKKKESESNQERLKINQQDENTNYSLTVNLKQLTRIDDIFGDQMAIKKEILKGNSTAKPEKMAKIYFELKIEIDGEIIYKSIDGDFPVLTEKQVFDFDFLEQQPSSWKYYLDEFKISKLLKNTIRRMKKQEYSILECRDKTLIQYGQDFEIIKEKCNGVIPDFVQYHIKLYNFTEGKNTFTMTIDDKVEQAQRKKVVGLRFIQEQNFKKACKTFEAINAFFELGKFIGEDAQKVHPHKISSLLNTSLCYLKIKKWDRLILTCDKILEIDPNNPKAIYRKCLALQEQSDFEKAIDILNNLLNSNQKIEENQLQELQKLRNNLIKSQHDYIKKQKQVFSKMFS
ncbi:hypothetical protein ABPG72_015922 [Tetrahymena utriculariae]